MAEQALERARFNLFADLRAYAPPALMALAAALLASIVLLAVNYVSATLPREQINAAIRQGFNDRQLVRWGWLPLNSDIGVHQFNDCLVLLMAVDDRAPALERSLSPTISGASVGTGGGGFTVPCPPLREFVSGRMEPLKPSDHYHRYVHGNVAVTAAMLEVFSIWGVRTIYGLLAQFTPLIVLGLALWRFARPREDSAGPVTLAFAAFTSFMLAAFFGVQYYGQSLAHFPADILLSLYLLTIVLGGKSLDSPIRFAMLNALFGALTMYFEFLSGGIPMGVSLVLAIASARALDRGGDMKKIFFAGCCFTLGVVTIYAVKQIATGIVFGSEVFGASGSRLSTWMGGVFPVTTIIRLFWQLRELAGGSQIAGGAMAAASIAAFFFAVYRLSDRKFPVQAGHWGFIWAALVIPVWWFTFSLHTYVHAWMMIRIMVFFNAASFFVLALIYRERIASAVEALAIRWRSLS